MTSRTVRTAGVEEELLARWPFWRANSARFAAREVWTDDTAEPTAALTLVGRHGGDALVGLGEPEALARVLGTAELPGGLVHALLPRGTWTHVPAQVRERFALVPGGSWDWLACDSQPEQRLGEDRAEILGTGTGALAAAGAVLARGYPERSDRDDDATRTWWGWRTADGELVAVLAARLASADGSGVHLSAVTVVPEHRRRGIASALTAAATRWGLAQGPLVHLGIWSDNDAARTLYLRLGFRVGAEIENLVPAQH
ncbi:GNAT family N-acetyltransferase [Georgenia subflava]|uniref:GNAT family N-acetyltransferase n=1 Tax=Georgenia subflava TaxID=1622177 RepID=A0A6N7EPK9_9MICO|nr:GNAT family N-acetyltransferase [Georgenia subflava]MPV39058.1 GNAT family N-acetyltransferase [Georgenia subflava]